MRNLQLLDEYRDRENAKRVYGSEGDETCGCFRVPSPIDGQSLVVIASSGDDWEHVSVSRSNRCPNWPEMSFIKQKFFNDDECVVEFHVPKSDHINVHPYTLHLWRKQGFEFPRPPGWMVGVPTKVKAI